MRAGEAGFYTYHVWRHWANQPAAYYWADSWQGRCSSIFDTTTNADGSINYAWDFSSSDVPIGLSINTLPPAQTNNDGVPAEVAVLPFSSFVTQPTGNYYEPGWPVYTQPLGLTSDLHPCTTKYDQSSYQGASNTFRPVWGMATDQVGLWSILGSFEFINGGPTKQKGAVSGDYMYNDDLEGHGLGSVPNPGAAAGEVFTKVIGPYFMYANTGTNHLQLWTNAQNVAAQMVSNWPYAWMNESEQDYPRHRGTVTGTLKAKTGESTANAVVILGDYVDGDWIFQGATNFLFWTTSDTNGNFSIPKVRPGNYQLFSYVPGIWGELQISNVVVLPDSTNNLGVINWNPPHLAQRLWRVGTPDHSSKEFHLGNYPKQFGLWWRYLNDKSTNDVNFVIGQSVESNDWYYAQCSVGLTPQSYPNLTDTHANEWHLLVATLERHFQPDQPAAGQRAVHRCFCRGQWHLFLHLHQRCERDADHLRCFRSVSWSGHHQRGGHLSRCGDRRALPVFPIFLSDQPFRNRHQYLYPDHPPARRTRQLDGHLLSRVGARRTDL
jgi:hypothetical protein